MRILLVICWLITSSFMPVNQPHPAFGLKVSYQSTGSIVSYIAYIDNGRAQSHVKMITEAEFIKVASGFWPSIYNPSKKNLFAEHHLNHGVLTDQNTLKEYTFCAPLDSVWKIHFQKNPLDVKKGAGWSNRQFNPSLSQELYLSKTYHVNHIDTEYFLDTNMWHLLQDVQDPVWIEKYKFLR